MTDAPRYMSLKTLAEALDVGTSTIEGWVVQGKFPAPKRVGPNGMLRWSWAEVRAHIEGPQANAATDTIGRIRDATRREATRSTRTVRSGNQGVLDVAEVQQFK